MSSVFGNTLVSGAIPYGSQAQGYMLGAAQPRQQISTTPFTRDDKNPFAAWLPFFGYPYNSDEDSRRDPYDQFPYDHKALPAAYRGRNVYLEQVMITSISEAQQWPIKKALPLMRNEKGMTIQWHQFQFDDHVLDRTPEEGVSRFVTMKETSGSDAMHRYGIGLRWEDGFLQTPLGQLHFRNNLLQMLNASIETMCLGADVALLQNDISKFPPFMLTDNLDRTTMAYINKLVDEEKAGFGILNKMNGAALLLMRLQTRYGKLNGASTPDANLLIIPNGSAVAYEFTHKEEYTFSQTGLVGGPQPTTAQRLFRGIETEQSRDHYLGEGDLQTDPYFTEFAIGNFFDFTHNYIREVKPEDYRTFMMDLMAFSSDKDDYHRFSYEDFVGMLRLYQPSNSVDDYAPMPGVAGRYRSTQLRGGKTRWQLTRYGQYFFGGHRTWGHYIKSRGGNIKTVCRGIVRDQPTFDSFKSRFMGGAIRAGASAAAVAATAAASAALAAEGNGPAAVKAAAATLAGAGAAAAALGIGFLGLGESLGEQKEEKEGKKGSETFISLLVALVRKNHADPTWYHFNIAAANFMREYSASGDEFQKSAESPLKWDPAVLKGDLATARQASYVASAPALRAIFSGRQLPVAEDEDSSAEIVAYPGSNLTVSIVPGDETEFFLGFVNHGGVVEEKGKKAKKAPVDPAEKKRIALNQAAVAAYAAAFELQFDRLVEWENIKNALKGGQDAEVPEDVTLDQWFFADIVRRSFLDAKMSVTGDGKPAVDAAGTRGLRDQRYRQFEDIGHKWIKQVFGIADVTGRSFRQREQTRYDNLVADAKRSPVKTAQQYMKAFADMSKFKQFHDSLVNAAPLLYRDANAGDDLDHAALRHIAKFDIGDGKSLQLKISEFCSVAKAIQTVWVRAGKDVTATNTVLLPLLEGLFVGVGRFKGYLGGNEGKRVLVTDAADSAWNDANAFPLTGLRATAADLLNAMQLKPSFAYNRVSQATGPSASPYGDPDGLLGLPGTHDYHGIRLGGVPFNNTLADATDIEAVLDGMPIDSGDFHMWCLEHDIYPLIKARGCRNEAIYEMGTAILMRAGGAAGGTFFGHQNFTVGSDPQRKMGVGHYTLYQRSLKLEPKLVVHGWCAWSRAYVGGNGHEIMDSLDRVHHDKHTRGERPASIIPVPVHLDERTEDQVIADVTGIFDPDLYDPTGSGKGALRPVPEMAPFCANKWGITRPQNPLRRKLFGGDDGSSGPASIHNTIMCRASTYHFNPKSCKFDIEILDQGHWGPTWYPGCVKVHNAQMVSLENRWGPYSRPTGSAAGMHTGSALM